MILSIIIPAYNAEPYIHELLDKLAPQITKDVEVIVIDDGSKTPLAVKHDFVKLIRQENGGASKARNTGLDTAKGQYIAFIDADDLVADNYIKTIIDKIKTEKFDYLYMSWKSFGGWNCDVKLKTIEDKFPTFNLCVWNRVYKRSMIGPVRFNEKKAVAEDAQFIREVHEQGKKKAFISDYMYFYRSNAADSLTKRATAGKLDIKRIIYNFPVVTEDMTYLIDEFKKIDEDAEIILMTGKNHIPELENYAMVVTPRDLAGTELRGQYTPLFHQIDTPLKTQVLIYVSSLHAIGGIETWTYNFCKQMHKYYDIMVLYDHSMDPAQRRRLLPIAQIVENTRRPIICDTAINCRIVLPLPKNIEYKQKIQVAHSCRMKDNFKFSEDADRTFYVSDTARQTFDRPGEVIYNMTVPEDPVKRPLLLVSASRLSWEKGESRIIKLAEMLKQNGILFTWLCFSDKKPDILPDGLVWREPTLDIKAYIKQADMFIQLSDQEAFCYSLVEALEMGVPVVTTPLPVLSEIGFKEGVNGYTVPFRIEDCQNIKEIFTSNLKGFKYSHNNAAIVEQWRAVLGDSVPSRRYDPAKGNNIVVATKDFRYNNRIIKENEIMEVPEAVAKEGCKQGFFEIIA